ncbi:hypothetical protein GCM10028811_14310 [Uliginosibacterium sediminicola]
MAVQMAAQAAVVGDAVTRVEFKSSGNKHGEFLLAQRRRRRKGRHCSGMRVVGLKNAQGATWAP